MNKIALFLTIITFLAADPTATEMPPQPTLKISSRSIAKENSFTYIGLGGCGPLLPLVPEATIGCRKLNAHHVWDLNAGGLPSEFLYGQISYLYFPKPSSGYYWGVGLTSGGSKFSLLHNTPYFKPYVNFPFTLGYQTIEPDDCHFMQVQITPLLTASFTYGIGF